MLVLILDTKANSFYGKMCFAGDLERKCDLEISPMCNQQADSVPAIQIGESTYARHQLLCRHQSRSEDVRPTFVLFFQGSSPTSWSLSLRSGSASPSPACSARPWWVTCTRTRAAGAAYGTHVHLQTHKHTLTPRSPSLREAAATEEEEWGKTSLNLPTGCWGISSSFVNSEEEYLSTSSFVLQRTFSHCWVVHRLWKSEHWMAEWLAFTSSGSLCWSGGLKSCRKRNRMT